MSELHKFIFEGLPVRGLLVRLSDAWVQMQAQQASSAAYPAPVQRLLGEMTAAAVMMQANIKFKGALVLQIAGDGPLKLAVVEVQSDLSFRATAKLMGEIADDAPMADMVNVLGQGRCAVTLDPEDKLPGQQAYQGVVSLNDAQGKSFQNMAQVLMFYMAQSEQLDTQMVLAANAELATGILIQRLPKEGGVAATLLNTPDLEAVDEVDDAYTLIASHTASLKSTELLGLAPDEVLHRLFWEESLLRFEPIVGNDTTGPRFACRCGRERVAGMLRNLGRDEVESILSERPDVEILCDFCGKAYRFDPVDAAALFATEPVHQQAPGAALQ
jgi:molecular chaperone Hsp33